MLSVHTGVHGDTIKCTTLEFLSTVCVAKISRGEDLLTSLWRQQSCSQEYSNPEKHAGSPPNRGGESNRTTTRTLGGSKHISTTHYGPAGYHSNFYCARFTAVLNRNRSASHVAFLLYVIFVVGLALDIQNAQAKCERHFRRLALNSACVAHSHPPSSLSSKICVKPVVYLS